MQKSTPTTPHAPQKPATGIRFPPELKKKIRALCLSSQRNFSEAVVFLILKGFDLLDQEERDRIDGERIRIEKRAHKSGSGNQGKQS